MREGRRFTFLYVCVCSVVVVVICFYHWGKPRYFQSKLDVSVQIPNWLWKPSPTKTGPHCLADRGCSARWCIPMDWGSVSGLWRGEHEELHLVVHLEGLSLPLACEAVPLRPSLDNNHRESGTPQHSLPLYPEI